MIWWISIVSYLWRNSVRRWCEQPLGVLGKLLVAALMGTLGAILILGSKFLGDELERQLASRDALTVRITESVSAREAAAQLEPLSAEAETRGWAGLADEVTTWLIPTAGAFLENGREAAVIAVPDMAALGYPDTPVLLVRQPNATSTTSPQEIPPTPFPPSILGSVVFTINELRFEALVMPVTPALESLPLDGDVILGSAARLLPLLQNGFTRDTILRARSIDSIERAQRVTEVMGSLDGRRVRIQSVLPILRQLEKIRRIQRYVLIGAISGSALVLGLVCGALAAMEFREERYLLALIRSFGVGRVTLLVHAVLENCLVAVAGVLIGFASLGLVTSRLELSAVQLGWLADRSTLWSGDGLWLLAGALCGGLLSCIPIGIGLRRPLGLVLK